MEERENRETIEWSIVKVARWLRRSLAMMEREEEGRAAYKWKIEALEKGFESGEERYSLLGFRKLGEFEF